MSAGIATTTRSSCSTFPALPIAQAFRRSHELLGGGWSHRSVLINRPRPIRQFEDGLENTVLIIEANDNMAVPWTEPRDFLTEQENISDGLFGLREDGFFMIWGGGRVGRVPKNIEQRLLRPMFSLDGGEDFEFSQAFQEPTAEMAITKPPVTDATTAADSSTSSAHQTTAAAAPGPVATPTAADTAPSLLDTRRYSDVRTITGNISVSFTKPSSKKRTRKRNASHLPRKC